MLQNVQHFTLIHRGSSYNVAESAAFLRQSARFAVKCCTKCNILRAAVPCRLIMLQKMQHFCSRTPNCCGCCTTCNISRTSPGAPDPTAPTGPTTAPTAPTAPTTPPAPPHAPHAHRIYRSPRTHHAPRTPRALPRPAASTPSPCVAHPAPLLFPIPRKQGKFYIPKKNQPDIQSSRLVESA